MEKVYENVAVGDNIDLECSLDIPLHEDYDPAVFTSMPTNFKQTIDGANFHLMGKLSPSFFGQIVKLWYVLRVIIKHESWNEWGEGSSVDFPIKILARHMHLVSQ